MANVTITMTNASIAIGNSGIGMAKNELISNSGKSAKSGAKAFVEAMAAGNELSVFGQSGDGFHSALLVSGVARAVNKSYDDEACIRESGTGGSLVVQESDIDAQRVAANGNK